jgi:hypothetical protein
MCQPASFVLTENEVYWSKTTDGHADIIEEFKLREGRAGTVEILLCEVTPPNGGDFNAPLDKWKYHVDDAYPVPQWYAAERDEARARSALVGWAAEKIVLAPTTLLKVGFKVAVYADIQSVEGGTIQRVWGGTIQSVEGGTIEIYASAMLSVILNVVTGIASVIVNRSVTPPVCYVGPQKVATKPSAKVGGEGTW